MFFRLVYRVVVVIMIICLFLVLSKFLMKIDVGYFGYIGSRVLMIYLVVIVYFFWLIDYLKGLVWKVKLIIVDVY